ncbi:membrane protein [Cuniculiplasma divulgatum]|uniref:Membrane protein n=1 Tax=Cuniculiplasma divulgatum TaxID=1673428 RepID=A0A1R4A8C9_9ARCH|nr:membrane protein [Cuniculiplasma divulgatum]
MQSPYLKIGFQIIHHHRFLWHYRVILGNSYVSDSLYFTVNFDIDFRFPMFLGFSYNACFRPILYLIMRTHM